jgi:hypothetical protein
MLNDLYFPNEYAPNSLIEEYGIRVCEKNYTQRKFNEAIYFFYKILQ